MQRSHSAQNSGYPLARWHGARRWVRGARPYLALLLFFATATLLIDFCMACLFQAMR